MNETIIQINEVQIFQEKKLVLDNINLNIDEGTFTYFIGRMVFKLLALVLLSMQKLML